MTYIRWLQAKGPKAHAEKTAEGIRRGRRPTPAFIVEAILTIKREDPRYSARRNANILSGGELHWSRATYHPNAKWIAQQLRNVFMDMETLPKAMVMDRDSILQPIANRTLPGMGIKPIRIAYRCPWQNAVVERFHRTLNEELLRYVQPHNDRHLNRLLGKFRTYYNTARPHMANGAEPPILPGLSHHPVANDPNFFKKPRKLVRKKWLGGLHSSYRWAA